MARAPRAKVPKTSGQGTSRLAYQKGYALGNRGKASAGVKAAPSVDNTGFDSRGGYAKAPKSGLAKLNSPKGIDISFGDTIRPSDLVGPPDKSMKAPDPRKPFNLKGIK
jgi:hypothetical protein